MAIFLPTSAPSPPRAPSNREVVNARVLRAAALGDARALQKALSRGGDPNCTLKDRGTSALENAAGQYGSVECVRILLRAGARFPTDGGAALVAGCLSAQRYDVAAALIEGGATLVPAVDSATASSTSIARDSVEIPVAPGTPLAVALQVGVCLRLQLCTRQCGTVGWGGRGRASRGTVDG